MKNETKPFEYEELYAMCLLCAAGAALITAERAFSNEVEGREMMEQKVKEVVAMRWDDPEKKPIMVES